MVRHMSNHSESWRKLDWKKFRRNLFRLQVRLWKAVRAGDKVRARNLQKLILRSQSARLLAIRQVTQLNQGKNTAGVDGKASLSFKERLGLNELLKIKVHQWEHQGLREIPIPKKDGTKRILKVPTISDRAWQCLAKYAIEPAHEALFHARSYGFRPGRSAHDAQKILFLSLSSQAKGKDKRVLELDIEKCFDRIDHATLMSKVIAPQSIKTGLWKCLKSGANPGFPEQGTPQGGVISPLLANIALDGIESIHNSVRYADDMVFILKPKDDAAKVLTKVEEFLALRGLNVKASKTKLVASTDGFDFLGWNFRVQQNGKFRSTPSVENFKAFRTKVKHIVNNSNYGAKVKAEKLAPIIRGWRNYHQYCKMDGARFSLWHGRRRTWKVFSKEHKLNRYQVDALIDKVFQGVPYSENKHINVKGDKSPFDGDIIYWSQRSSNRYNGDTAKALRKQHYRCGQCGLKFNDEERVQLHHIDGNHNNWKLKNLVAIHESCHDYIHMSKGISQDYREPDARKRACPDLSERGGE
ncbi:reverse transcriptase N-terminal domain-containing protein [Microcoleus sp. FACHB-1]|nr:reverse transcriptase N-terminal domain-containing protein [Microcoleus sp. FACHB-1]